MIDWWIRYALRTLPTVSIVNTTARQRQKGGGGVEINRTVWLKRSACGTPARAPGPCDGGEAWRRCVEIEIAQAGWAQRARHRRLHYLHTAPPAKSPQPHPSTSTALNACAAVPLASWQRTTAPGDRDAHLTSRHTTGGECGVVACCPGESVGGMYSTRGGAVLMRHAV